MKNIILVFVIICFCSTAWAQLTNRDRLDQIRSLKRLVFASCNKHTREQPLWNQMAGHFPDLFIWGGDTVYADGKGVEEILNAYKLQDSVVDYASFKSRTPIIGIWDDHDYGKNNGGNDFKFKKLSQNYFLNFMEEPLSSLRREQEGIYTSYSFGKHPSKIKIILIDNRYLKDIKKGALLGEPQWQWLEQEIKNSDASLHLLVSGISVLSPKTVHTEEWADYPSEKNRLKNIMKSVNTPYLYLAGDKHFSDIYSKGDELEFLSSGMTHNTEVVVRPLIRSLYPSPVFEHNYGMIDFGWDENLPVLNLSIRTEDGKTRNPKKIKWDKTHWTEI
jgi:alkaline phosphatase D